MLNIKEVNWEFVYILSNDCTLDNALKMFQYKLYIPTNTFLYKCRLVETELRAFCGETGETIMHLFCNIVNNIWLKIYEQLQIRCGGLSRRDILLGIENVDYLYIYSIMLITKYCIYSCNFKKVVPSFSGVMSLLRHKCKIFFFSASMLPPAKRQRVRDRWHEILLFMGEDYETAWVEGVNISFCVFVYYIYCTTLLMYGIVTN
jgi:hypothetical protein